MATRKKKPTTTKTTTEPESTSIPSYDGAPFVIHEVDCICENKFSRHIAHSAPPNSFQVFQVVEEDGNVLPGIFKCDDCGRKWRVTDVNGEHELMDMDAPASYEIEGLIRMLHPSIVNALEIVGAPTSRYAWAYWVVVHKKWGSVMTIGTRMTDNPDVVKYRQLTIDAANKASVSEMSTSGVVQVNMEAKKRKKK